MKTDRAEVAADSKVRPWTSIRVKLIVGLLLLTVITGVTVWFIVAEQQERLFTGQLVREAGAATSRISRDFAKSMLGGGGKAVWSELTAEAREIIREKQAARVLVFLGDGSVMSGSDEAAIGTRIEVRGSAQCPACDSTRPEDFPASARVSLADGRRGLRVVSPIPVTHLCRSCHTKDDEPHSYVAVDFDLSPLERARTERHRSILITGLVSSIVLVLLVTLLFRRLVMRPVESLAESMAHVAAGDLSARTRVTGGDELAALGRDFNRMAGRIEDQVARIEAARAESDLLYRLVIESSKSLETSEFASGVSRVIMEKLLPQRVVFLLAGADRGWTCVTRERAGTAATENGQGTLEAALASNSGQVPKLLHGVPRQFVEEALRVRVLQLVRGAADLTFVLPVVSESRLLGLLACAGIPASVRVEETLLNNLGAHLTLAAVNSRNYTGAMTDALTRLKNKRYGLVRLEEAVDSARRYGADLALAMCDIDYFKRVNDAYGHPAGDAVLQKVSHRIAGCVRKSDVAVRYGGEEFMLILFEAPLESLATIGEKIRREIEATPVDLGSGGSTVPLTLSVGLAAFRADSDSGETLIARADAALYRAKEGGRNRVVVDAA